MKVVSTAAGASASAGAAAAGAASPAISAARRFMYSSKDSPSGIVLRGSSLTTGVGSLVCAFPPIDQPISSASESLVGEGFGSTPPMKVVSTAAGASASAGAAAAGAASPAISAARRFMYSSKDSPS